jgi:hypothetical protein
MRLSRLTATAAATATAIAILTGCGLAHHAAAPAARPAGSHAAAPAAPAARLHALAIRPAPADPSLAWLQSPGGQAQVTFNDDVDALAGALYIENYSPTTANHLAFEADARVVRAEAAEILATPALLPTTHRAGYIQMLDDFISVANLLQPGVGYGTTSQDYTAWFAALRASNIIVY